MNSDVQSIETRQQDANTLLHHYIQFLKEKDIEGWINLWDDNCVLEFPFAPQGRLSLIEGKAALRPYIQAVVKDIELGTPQQQIYLTLDPDLIITEFSSEGRIISTGRTFNARYVWIMRTKNGKLFHMRDYWNPLAALEARS